MKFLLSVIMLTPYSMSLNFFFLERDSIFGPERKLQKGLKFLLEFLALLSKLLQKPLDILKFKIYDLIRFKFLIVAL